MPSPTWVTLPTYDEAENLERLVPAMRFGRRRWDGSAEPARVPIA